MLIVGAHVDIKQDLEELKSLGCTAFQVLPTGFNTCPVVPEGMVGYMHLPLSTNIANAATYRTLVPLIESLLSECEAKGYSGLVVHPGIRKEEEDLFDSVVQVVSLLNRFVSEVPILVEVDPGAKKGTRIGSLETCIEIVRCTSSNVKLCYGTCHDYVRGSDINNDKVLSLTLGKLKPYLALVHLNSTGPKSTLGSCLDRHSETTIEASQHLKPQTILKIARVCESWDIPVILEREFELAKQDLVYLSSSFNLTRSHQ